MNKTLLIIILIVVLLLGGMGALFIIKPEWMPIQIVTPNSPLVSSTTKASGYSAVFLTNNQIYFGKLKNIDSDYPVLTDVYYLRVQRSLSENTEDNVKVEDKKSPVPEAKNELTLIKLGSELHGPTDEIKLNREHIMFIEDLKEDGKVVQAIKNHKSKKS